MFQDEVIARHQQFITCRRALRDSPEYRDVTFQEWAEFEKHFQLRRVDAVKRLHVCGPGPWDVADDPNRTSPPSMPCHDRRRHRAASSHVP